MYYEVLGTIENENHNLGGTNDKHGAIETAKFMVDYRGYDCCLVVTEECEIVYEYKRGK
jgi:hypothetical protein